MPSGIGQIEQISYACIFEQAESEGAGVHDRGQAEDGGQQMRHDTQRTTQSRPKARALAAHEPGRDRENRACAGNEDDDEGGDEEVEGDH